MKMFSAISTNVVKLMDATSVLINSVHDICSMAEVITSTALKEQQLESEHELAKLKASMDPA